MTIPSHFAFQTKPKADPAAIVLDGQARFTVISAHTIRMEFNPTGNFEDRPSQVVWFREQPVPEFERHTHDGELEIITERLHLRYMRGKPFTSNTLSIRLLGTPGTWTFGMEQKENLLGTTRTLDGVDGAVNLEPGLLSRRGWTVIDDSGSLVFGEDHWLAARQGEGVDLYFIHYGLDYRLGMAEFYRIAGKPGLIPRWSLGNWWSRYWEYSADELAGLMQEFKARNVPLAVCIIDMDWHLTKTGNDCSGWTGYTWNNALFPDPQGFLRTLHEMGLKTGLNLHPAEGIWPHEGMYPQMALAMGIDPASKQQVRFDIENPDFVYAYFKYLHHPQEAQGVDFWWMDWQQGNPSHLPGLNILWWINHLHYLDAGRDPQKRSFLFSRWGGLGNHRYPIGFSGDTVVSWASLAFQPYMTATAANVGYSWWSHDIGGHMGGMEDRELYTRWVQYGVFSPIMRLHSTKNPYHERRPWGYDASIEKAAGDALRLRQRLIPYIYSMAWKDHQEGYPLVRPLYHLEPEEEETYACPNIYTFGTELLAAPFTSPTDPNTRLARQVAWLPGAGKDWFGFLDGKVYAGGQWHSLFGNIETIPVFARAGAIVPLTMEVGWGGVSFPLELEVHIFPGAANEFVLYEDDGESQAYKQGDYAQTQVEQTWQPGEQVVYVHPAEGSVGLLPLERTWNFVFHNVTAPGSVKGWINNHVVPAQVDYKSDKATLRLRGIVLEPQSEFKVIIKGCEITQGQTLPDQVKQLVESFKISTELRRALVLRVEKLVEDPFNLSDFIIALSPSQLRALFEILTSAGVEKRNQDGKTEIILWNNAGIPQVRFVQSIERSVIHNPDMRYTSEVGSDWRSKVIFPERAFGAARGLWSVDYGGIFRVEETSHHADRK